jgi:uncharacterized protein (TIGR02145 family)
MMIANNKKKISAIEYILGILIIISFSCSKQEKPPDPVKDIDGNSYKTVKIGTQIWMAENLKTTRFNNGTEITLVTDTTIWGGLKTPGYCWYDNDPITYKEPYGALYNGFTAADSTLCPDGWHVPSKDDLHQLMIFLGDSASAGGKLKEAGTTHWLTPNKGADNSSGFGALASGIRYFEGSFTSVSYYTGFWSATKTGITDQWFMGLYYREASVVIDRRTSTIGLSVRCIKD